MTELEKIAYAKSFIDKLANGINPLDDSVVPDGDIVNNVRLSRCFFYVSDILRQVIDNGGPVPVQKEKKPKKTEFYLTPEQADAFPYSRKPITATDIAERIIAIGPTDGVKKFPRKKMIAWLISLGLIQETEIGGKIRKVPTESGIELGITLEERTSIYGPYNVTVYDETAQHFIVDNIEALLAFDLSKDDRETD